MRTTLDLDDRVLRAARTLADQRGSSLGAAVSELALRGLAGSNRTTGDGPAPTGFPVLGVGPSDHLITDELVIEHRDDQ